jgi:hypothetical protein
VFESKETFDDQPNEALAALPQPAIRCLRSCTTADKARAEGLQHGHSRNRADRLHVAAKRTAAGARELAQEAR